MTHNKKTPLTNQEKFIIGNDSFTQIINKNQINLIRNTSQIYKFFDRALPEELIKLNEAIDNLAELIHKKNTSSSSNRTQKLVELFAYKINKERKNKILIENNTVKVEQLKINLENGEDQAKRLTDLLAIIFNSYRTIDNKNKLIRSLSSKLETKSYYSQKLTCL